jgi:hypothetical protein
VISTQECPGLTQILDLLRRNLNCSWTVQHSYPLLTQVYELLSEEDPHNDTLLADMSDSIPGMVRVCLQLLIV